MWLMSPSAYFRAWIAVLVCLFVFPMPGVSAQTPESQPVVLPFNLGLIPPVSVAGAVAAATDRPVVNRFSMVALYGQAAGIEGVEMAGLASLTGHAHGAQMAGILNRARTVEGAQVAGVLNLVSRNVEGAQVAGLLNIAGQAVAGAQVGVVNVAADAATVQVGVVNVTGTARGAQVGVVNLSARNEGVPIGLFSRVAEVGLAWDLWVDETGGVSAAVRSGTGRVSNYVGIVGRGGDSPWGLVAGLGAEWRLSGPVTMGLEGFSQSLHGNGFDGAGNLAHVRGKVGLDVGPVSFFAGPTLNYFVSAEDEGADLAPGYSRLRDIAGIHIRTWAGFAVGVRVGSGIVE